MILLGDKIQESLRAFNSNFGPLASKVEYKGVTFLMLYAENIRENCVIAGYDPLKWLEQELDKAKDKPVIIFTHSPKVQDYFNDEIHPGWPENMREKWDKLIQRTM